MLKDKQESLHTRLRLKLKMLEDMLKLKLLVLKLKREWKKSVPQFNSELRRNKLKEKHKLKHIRPNKRESDSKEKLKLMLLDLREKNNSRLIMLSKKLPKLNTSRE